MNRTFLKKPDNKAEHPRYLLDTVVFTMVFSEGEIPP
jgi:hypothetical protein